MTGLLVLSGVKHSHANDFSCIFISVAGGKGDRSLDDQGGLCIYTSKY